VKPYPQILQASPGLGDDLLTPGNLAPEWIQVFITAMLASFAKNRNQGFS
jgi:hypothetical protein